MVVSRITKVSSATTSGWKIWVLLVTSQTLISLAILMVSLSLSGHVYFWPPCPCWTHLSQSSFHSTWAECSPKSTLISFNNMWFVAQFVSSLFLHRIKMLTSSLKLIHQDVFMIYFSNYTWSLLFTTLSLRRMLESWHNQILYDLIWYDMILIVFSFIVSWLVLYRWALFFVQNIRFNTIFLFSPIVALCTGDLGHSKIYWTHSISEITYRKKCRYIHMAHAQV